MRYQTLLNIFGGLNKRQDKIDVSYLE